MATLNPLKTVMGPLWKLYSDKNVWEILIDAHDEIYYVKNQELINSGKIFKNEAEVNLLVKKLLAFNKTKPATNEHSYFFNLDKFTRVSIVMPPLAIKGPAVVIRRIPEQNVTLDNLIEWNALDQEGKKTIETILSGNKGFLIAGNIGSGKTTLLNVLVNAIPLPNRVVTLERSQDLVITREKVCRLQTQSTKASEMVDLIETAERMRADYLVLSDAAGPEVMPFMDMVRNNCTGIMLTTGENVIDAIKRVETKAVISSDGLTLEEVRYAMAQSFKNIIFQEKLPDGKRKITSINELVYESGELKLKTIYKR